MAKLVIEITEEKLSIIKNKMYCGIYDSDLYKAIANGTPLTDILDKIRAEIEAIIGERDLDDYDFCSGLICARKILDKYMAESEDKFKAV